mmetsp:Transcript_6997/g.7786  ORF Transcript_6997/g.7786 Transcript_6997/m.7786 type:complete len:850 (-) Transcript_6997:39-2588(-)
MIRYFSTIQRSNIVTRPLARRTYYYNDVIARQICEKKSKLIACITERYRLFSSFGGDNRGAGGGGGGDRDGRNVQKPRNQEWRKSNNNNNNNNHNQQNNWRSDKKTNYSDKFLQPAARGELKNHRSGIPKLTGRKGKGRGIRGADPLLGSEYDELMGYDNDNDGSMMMEDVDFSNNKMHQQHAKPKTGTIDKGSKLEDLCPEEYQEVMEFAQMYKSLEHYQDKEEYYWNEIDYEGTNLVKKKKMFEKLKAEATRDADGKLVVEVDDETFAMFDGVEDGGSMKNKDDGSPNSQQRQQQKPNQKQQDFNRPEVDFILDTMGVKGYDKPPNPKEYDIVKPLVLKGPTMYDFVESMMEHPHKYGQLRYVSPHPESTRLPVPDLPNRRRNPPVDFVEAHSRFIFVWGIPPLLSVDDQPGDLDNPLHLLELQKTAAALFDVPPESVYPASISSAFVGFPSRMDQRFALEFGPVQKVIGSPVKISSYTPKEGDKKLFDTNDMDSVVLLENLPSGLTPSLLASTLFPSGTDAGDLVYGGLTLDDFVMLTPHSAVLRFESKDHADSAVKSSIVEQRLKDFGQHRIRYNKTRREIVYTGKHTGPAGEDLERELGPRLIVDGDMPTKNFYLSHAAVVHLRNLDPSVTKHDISKFFQSSCAMSRDVEGSIEFVTCYEGLPTGKAYVGFDEHGEAEVAMAVCESSGRVRGLGPNKVIMKKVKDSKKVVREKRPTRDEDELLDSLNNWEQYVDPKDIEVLLENGISKDALDESLRAIRYHNPTFSSLDQAIRSEAMNPEMDAGGMYRELVQTYIETLKECISTPNDPGPVYESLFLPDEEPDTEIFKDEPIRQEELRKRREVP